MTKVISTSRHGACMKNVRTDVRRTPQPQSRTQHLIIGIAACLFVSFFLALHSFALSDSCPQLKVVIGKDVQSPDRKLGIAALYEKYGGTNLNRAVFKLLDIDVDAPISQGDDISSGSCVMDCQWFCVKTNEYLLHIHRPTGILSLYLGNRTSPMPPAPSNHPICEQEATAKAKEMLAITNPYLVSPRMSVQRMGDGSIWVGFPIARHPNAGQDGSINIDSNTGRIVHFETIPLDALPKSNAKVSEERAKQIAVDYAIDQGIHRPQAIAAVVSFLRQRDDESQTTPHVCATDYIQPGYVWSVHCKPQRWWSETVGLFLSTSNNKGCVVWVDGETGKVLRWQYPD